MTLEERFKEKLEKENKFPNKNPNPGKTKN
jgi:hypothetical protein